MKEAPHTGARSRTGPRVRMATVILISIAIGLGAAAILGWATPFGLGLRDDSFTYLSSAESLAVSGRYGRLSGDGSFKPVTNFPPLYSGSLAAASLMTGEMRAAAKLLNMLLLGTLVVLSGVTVWRATGSALASLLAALLIALSDVVLQAGSWALSELLFLCLITATAWFLFEHLHRPSRAALAAAAAALGLALLTRYAGISFVAAAAICLLWFRRSDPRRLRELSALLVIALAPLALFLLRNLALTADAVNRPGPYWHPPSPAELEAGLETLIRWILPERWMASIPLWGGGLAALGVVLLVGYGTWRYLAPARGDALGINVRPRPLAALLGLNILLYAVFVLASVSAFDALTPLNDRILSPVYTQGILLALTLATVYWPRWGTAGRVLAGAACVAFVFFQGYRVAFAAQGLRSDGQGYAGQQWRDSHVLDYACNLPDVPLYSNDLPALYFACGRIATALPSLVNLSTGLPNPGFETEVEAVVDRARLSGALVIFVGWSGEERMQRTGFSELARRLTLLRSFDDGRVYVSP